MSDNKQPFFELKPNTVIDAVESIGYLSDGRIMALNSYENRVYQVGLDESEPLIAKFYRPQRWTDEQIGEEHRFMAQLVEQDLSVVAPIKSDTGQTLFSYDDYRFFGGIQQLRGAHFLSHDLWTLGICWLVAVVCCPLLYRSEHRAKTAAAIQENLLHASASR